jgi:hypothetical protein
MAELHHPTIRSMPARLATGPVCLGLTLLCVGLGAAEPASPAKKPATPEALQADIEALKPAKHAWRAIPWKTCPLEALTASREQKKPILAWVFLGIPTDERC